MSTESLQKTRSLLGRGRFPTKRGPFRDHPLGTVTQVLTAVSRALVERPSVQQTIGRKTRNDDYCRRQAPVAVEGAEHDIRWGEARRAQAHRARTDSLVAAALQ